MSYIPTIRSLKDVDLSGISEGKALNFDSSNSKFKTFIPSVLGSGFSEMSGVFNLGGTLTAGVTFNGVSTHSFVFSSINSFSLNANDFLATIGTTTILANNGNATLKTTLLDSQTIVESSDGDIVLKSKKLYINLPNFNVDFRVGSILQLNSNPSGSNLLFKPTPYALPIASPLTNGFYALNFNSGVFTFEKNVNSIYITDADTTGSTLQNAIDNSNSGIVLKQITSPGADEKAILTEPTSPMSGIGSNTSLVLTTLPLYGFSSSTGRVRRFIFTTQMVGTTLNVQISGISSQILLTEDGIPIWARVSGLAHNVAAGIGNNKSWIVNSGVDNVSVEFFTNTIPATNPSIKITNNTGYTVNIVLLIEYLEI